MAADVLSQELPPMFVGEDKSYDLRGIASSSDPTTWAVKFTVIPFTGTTASVSSPTITRVVSGSVSPWLCTFTCPLSNAQTSLFGAGSAQWQLERTDTGHKIILADGTLVVDTPPTPIV